MNAPAKRTEATSLKAMFHDGGEFALLDAREEVPFDQRHLLMASCVPLGRLELIAGDLVPRPDTRVVWCDDGEGLAEAAAMRMSELGYTEVSVLAGGVNAWEKAGFNVYSGVHVPSKAFAEVVEHEAHTPWIDVHDLKALIDAKADIVILDSRTYEEYHGNSIPGAISVPGAELVYRFADLVPSPDTKVIVNCGGRTRSIIGAQSLINAGVPNDVVSLKNGTQDWHLAGFEVMGGAQRQAPDATEQGRAAAVAAAARVAQRFEIQRLDSAGLDKRRAMADEKNVYLLDVRTSAEYARGHLPGTRSAPGGQLIQETDVYLGAWGGSVTVVDTDGVRAVMTASWLKQMGWSDIAVHTFDEDALRLDSGAWRARVLGAPASSATAWISPAALSELIGSESVQVVDFDYSDRFKRGHIPGAWFALRERLDIALQAVSPAQTLVFTCPNGDLAALAAAGFVPTARHRSVRVLEGGTSAWVAAGLALEVGPERLASPADDVRLKAREMNSDIEAAMRAYLAWEIDLVNQMAVDDDHRFRVGVPA